MLELSIADYLDEPVAGSEAEPVTAADLKRRYPFLTRGTQAERVEKIRQDADQPVFSDAFDLEAAFSQRRIQKALNQNVSLVPRAGDASAEDPALPDIFGEREPARVILPDARSNGREPVPVPDSARTGNASWAQRVFQKASQIAPTEGARKLARQAAEMLGRGDQ